MSRQKWTKKEFIFLFFITAAAAFLRLYQLDKTPFGINHDAAWNGLGAIYLLEKLPDYIPYFESGWRGETLFRYFITAFIQLFGPTPLAVRLTSVTFGALTLPSFYLLARELFNRKIALLSLFFLATSGWHIVMSKTGWRTIAVPLFQTLTFLFLIRGLKTKNKIWPFVISGVSLSLAVNSYDMAGRITVVLVGIFLIQRFFINKQFLKNYFKQLLVFTVTFCLTIFPLVSYAVNNWINFTGRANFLFVGNRIQETQSLRPLWENLQRTFLMFNVRAGGDDFFVNEPLLELIPGIFFVVGVGIAFIRLRQRRNLFVLLWLIMALLPGFLSIPNGNRGIGSLVPVYLLAGLGLYWYVQVLYKSLPAKVHLLVTVSIMFVLAGQILCSYNQYLSYNRWEIWGFYPETTIVGQYIQKIKNEYNIYITDNYPRDILTFLTYEKGREVFKQEYQWFRDSNQFLNVPKTKDSGLVFIMFDTPPNQLLVQKLKVKFPGISVLRLPYTNDRINRVAALVALVHRGN